jgi:hypothetical protein
MGIDAPHASGTRTLKQAQWLPADEHTTPAAISSSVAAQAVGAQLVAERTTS